MGVREPAELSRMFAKHFTAQEWDKLFALYEPEGVFVGQEG